MFTKTEPILKKTLIQTTDWKTMGLLTTEKFIPGNIYFKELQQKLNKKYLKIIEKFK